MAEHTAGQGEGAAVGNELALDRNQFTWPISPSLSPIAYSASLTSASGANLAL